MKPSIIAVAVSLTLTGCSNYVLRGALVPHGPDPTVVDSPEPNSTIVAARPRAHDGPPPIVTTTVAAGTILPPDDVPRTPAVVPLPVSTARVSPAAAILPAAVAPVRDSQAAMIAAMAPLPKSAAPLAAMPAKAVTAPAAAAPAAVPAIVAPAARESTAAASPAPVPPSGEALRPLFPTAAAPQPAAHSAEELSPAAVFAPAAGTTLSAGAAIAAAEPATPAADGSSAVAAAQGSLVPTLAMRNEPLTYHVRAPDETGVKTVFDDAHNTYIVFESAIPPELVLFGADGEPIKYDRYGTTAVAQGVHRGIVIRTYTGKSIATPEGPLHMSREMSLGGAKALRPPVVAGGPIDSTIEQARAGIAQAKGRLSTLSEEVERAAKGESARPIASVMHDLEQLETRISGVSGTLVRVHFAGASSRLDLSDASRSALISAARQAKMIIVRGRTDATGRAEGNRKVAKARAISARNLLLAGGIDPTHLKMEYRLGDYVASNQTAQGRAQNRRAEIILVSANNERIKVVLDLGESWLPATLALTPRA